MSNWKITTHQMLKKILYKTDIAFCSEKKRTRFWIWDVSASRIPENFAHKDQASFFLIRENDIFCDFRAFREIMILKRNLATRQILNWKGNNASQFDLKENNASDFELNKYSASEFELKETTRQILNLRKPKASEFELKLLLHVRFGIGKKQIFGFWIWTFTTCRIPNWKVTTHWIF